MLDLDAVGGGVGGDKKDEEGKEGDGSDAADARVTLDRTRRGGKEDDKTPLLPLAALLQSMKDGMRLSHKQREVERRIPRAVARRETERLVFLRPIEKCRRAFFSNFVVEFFFSLFTFLLLFRKASRAPCSSVPSLLLSVLISDTSRHSRHRNQSERHRAKTETEGLRIFRFLIEKKDNGELALAVVVLIFISDAPLHL